MKFHVEKSVFLVGFTKEMNLNNQLEMQYKETINELQEMREKMLN